MGSVGRKPRAVAEKGVGGARCARARAGRGKEGKGEAREGRRAPWAGFRSCGRHGEGGRRKGLPRGTRRLDGAIEAHDDLAG